MSSELCPRIADRSRVRRHDSVRRDRWWKKAGVETRLSPAGRTCDRGARWRWNACFLDLKDLGSTSIGASSDAVTPAGECDGVEPVVGLAPGEKSPGGGKVRTAVPAGGPPSGVAEASTGCQGLLGHSDFGWVPKQIWQTWAKVHPAPFLHGVPLL